MTLLFALPLAAGDGRIRRATEPVPGQYIVTFEDPDGSKAAASAHALANAHGGRVIAVYERIFSGFAVALPEAAAVALARNPLVKYVSEDSVVRISEGGISASQVTGEGSGLWHLDRSDQRQVDISGLDERYGYCSDGQGIVAYIVDTGIRANHTEFGGRVKDGPDYGYHGWDDSAGDPCADGRPADGGHGTAVASVLGGATYGIAKGVELVPVRVLNCIGDTVISRILDGLDWIITPRDPDATHITQGNPDFGRPGVVNMSWWRGQAEGTELRAAIDALHGENLAVFTSANNQPRLGENGPILHDACQMEPSAYSRSSGGKAITVGGTMLSEDGKRDLRWWSGPGPHQASSYGACVDLWAPAYTIRVADYQTDAASKLSSGTSYSSPLVAGLAARLLSRYPNLNPDEVWDSLRERATNEDSTGQRLIREPTTIPPELALPPELTMPNARMAHFKDGIAGRCRPLRRDVSITKQPASWTLPAGSQVTLSVETDEWVEFQWYRGATGDMSQPIPGATEATFTIPPLGSTTLYWVKVIGETNAVNSNTATITLGACPGISVSVSPSNATILQGESLTLTATASSVNPLTWQWYKDDGWGYGPILNATGPSIIVSPSSFTRYSVVAGNGCRTVGSNTVYVTVSKEYAIALGTYYGNYVGAEGGGGAGVHAVASAPNQWERFILRDLNGGQLVDGDFVTLRSHSGHYLVAEWCGGEGQTVNANRTTAGDWETFQIQSMDGNYWIGHGSNVAFKACSGSGYYAVAEFGGLNGGGPGAGEVNCDRTQPGAWETFQLLWH